MIRDQLHRPILLPDAPLRIISLVPSQTELLHHLGLEEEVVGITKFCVHPEEWFRHKTRVGGTKHYDFEKIHRLRPNLIIANKEENDERQVNMLMERYPVWVSDVKTLEDAYDMIAGIGEATNRHEKAELLVAKIKTEFYNLAAVVDQRTTLPTVAYLIWQHPFMTVGNDTFIHHLLETAGFKNVFERETRYPQISASNLQTADPDLLFLSSEPFPFSAKHIYAIQQICPKADIRLVDGALFSWYGSRLLQSAGYLGGLVREVHRLT